MRVMPAMAAIAVGTIAMGIGLLGCVSPGDVPGFGSGADGLRCGLPVVDGRVHIEIRYAGNGTPSAMPAECTVAPGTRIIWRGPEDSAAPFVIAFAGASPEATGGHGRLASDSVDARQKVVIVAGGDAGTYKYGIAANGITVDPTIIIRP